MAKRKPPRKRRRVNRTERVDPTPETKAKLKPDCLLEMTRWHGHYRPLLDSSGENAAQEIREVYLAITRGLWTKVPGQIHGALEEMPDHLAEAYSKRYRPWVNRTNREIVDLVLRLVVEREPVGKWVQRVCAGAIMDYARHMRK